MSNFKLINLTHKDPATGIETVIGMKVPARASETLLTELRVIGIEIVDRSTLRKTPSKVFSPEMDAKLLQMKTRGFKMQEIADRLDLSRQACYARYYILVNHKGIKHSSHAHKPTRLNTRVSKSSADLLRDYSNASGMSLNMALDSILKSTVVKDYVESHPSVIAHRESEERKRESAPSRVKLRGVGEKWLNG